VTTNPELRASRDGKYVAVRHGVGWVLWWTHAPLVVGHVVTDAEVADWLPLVPSPVSGVAEDTGLRERLARAMHDASINDGYEFDAPWEERSQKVHLRYLARVEAVMPEFDRLRSERDALARDAERMGNDTENAVRAYKLERAKVERLTAERDEWKQAAEAEADLLDAEVARSAPAIPQDAEAILLGAATDYETEMNAESGGEHNIDQAYFAGLVQFQALMLRGALPAPAADPQASSKIDQDLGDAAPGADLVVSVSQWLLDNCSDINGDRMHYHATRPMARKLLALIAAHDAASPAPATGDAPCSCNGGWVEDQNFQPEDYERNDPLQPGKGLIPCGFCNHGGWDAPWPPEQSGQAPAQPTATPDDGRCSGCNSADEYWCSCPDGYSPAASAVTATPDDDCNDDLNAGFLRPTTPEGA
jgi:hypothetical protein